MQQRINNFMICENNNGRLVLKHGIELLNSEFTLDKYENEQVITILSTGDKYILNKKLMHNGVEYCAVCESNKVYKLIKKCERILGVYLLTNPIGTIRLTDVDILNVYDIPESYEGDGILVGLNNNEPKKYKIKFENRTFRYYFTCMGKRHYLNKIIKAN